MIWAIIIGMGLVLFCNRYLFLEPRLPLRLSSNARQFLGYAVPGMLTAICGPIIFLQKERPDLGLDNPYLLASLVAVMLMLRFRNMLLSLGLSMLFFFMLRGWFGH